MRMVHPQGLTFRITLPHGLRILFLGAIKAINKGRDKILSRLLCASGRLALSIWRSSKHYEWGFGAAFRVMRSACRLWGPSRETI